MSSNKNYLDGLSGFAADEDIKVVARAEIQKAMNSRKITSNALTTIINKGVIDIDQVSKNLQTFKNIKISGEFHKVKEVPILSAITCLNNQLIQNIYDKINENSNSVIRLTDNIDSKGYNARLCCTNRFLPKLPLTPKL